MTPRGSASRNSWLAIVAAVALIMRVLAVMFYQPVAYSDTPSYRRLADTVQQGFANYDGTRTPGYPVFLALTGTDRTAWLVQLTLGFIATLLLFYIGWKLTDQAWFGGVIAIAHTLNLGQLFFESNLLTESITTFFLILTMAGLLIWLESPGSRRTWLAFGLGLASSITLLIRPLFIYLPFTLLFFLLVDTWVRRRSARQGSAECKGYDKPHTGQLRWYHTLAWLVPVVLLLGGWVTFMHKQFNEWALTTMTGYHLVQHTGNFFEYVPDEYATIRDIYISYRDAHIAKYGTQTNAIWDAIPEMSRVSGYSFYALSRVLTSISLQLIEQHPLLFIRSAISGWWMFWRAPVYWSADVLKIQALVPVVRLTIQGERGVLFLINLAFIAASLYFIIREGVAAIRRKSLPLSKRWAKPVTYSFLWILALNIWIASILQTLLDHGDNPRFLVPMQSLVVLWMGAFVLLMIRSRHPQPSNTAQP